MRVRPKMLDAVLSSCCFVHGMEHPWAGAESRGCNKRCSRNWRKASYSGEEEGERKIG